MNRKIILVVLLTVFLVMTTIVSVFAQKIFVWNNDRGDCKQEYPDVGRWDSKVSIVVWQDPRRGDYDIWGQKLPCQ